LNATLQDVLKREGIARLGDIYTTDEMRTLNVAVDPIFSNRASERRAYVHPDEILATGLWPLVFSKHMRAILFSVMPDPVLYHCHVYEIAGESNEPHIFGESLSGWHCDVDDEEDSGEPTHLSLFVYLTEVGAENGAFEFAPATSRQWLKPNAPYASVLGPPGFTFLWNRRFFHRAAPNHSSLRRRILKLSIQRNRYLSTHLENEHFRKVRECLPVGDWEMDILLGRYQGTTAPLIQRNVTPTWAHILPNATLKIPAWSLLTPQIRRKAALKKARFLRSLAARTTTQARG